MLVHMWWMSNKMGLIRLVLLDLCMGYMNNMKSEDQKELREWVLDDSIYKGVLEVTKEICKILNNKKEQLWIKQFFL